MYIYILPRRNVYVFFHSHNAPRQEECKELPDVAVRKHEICHLNVPQGREESEGRS